MVAGWTNIALGLLCGFATTVGFLSGNLSGSESPFFVLVACLLVAVGVFVLALRFWPATIFGLSLFFLGLLLGFGLLVGGSVFGAAEAARHQGRGRCRVAAGSARSVVDHRDAAPSQAGVRRGEPFDDRAGGRSAGAGGKGPEAQNGVRLSG